jgi:hypothetical protein
MVQPRLGLIKEPVRKIVKDFARSWRFTTYELVARATVRAKWTRPYVLNKPPPIAYPSIISYGQIMQVIHVSYLNYVHLALAHRFGLAEGIACLTGLLRATAVFSVLI